MNHKHGDLVDPVVDGLMIATLGGVGKVCPPEQEAPLEKGFTVADSTSERHPTRCLLRCAPYFPQY